MCRLGLRRAPGGVVVVALVAMLLIGVSDVPPAASLAGTSYTVTSRTASLSDPGKVDIGNHCDDCVTTVSPGFSVRVYGRTYSTLNVSSNGNVQLDTASIGYRNSTLPDPNFGTTVFVLWADLRTDGPGHGIFSNVVGGAGRRSLILEWRASAFGSDQTVDVALVLHEDTSSFEVYYLTLPAANGRDSTEGVQETGLGPATEWGYDEANLFPNQELVYTGAQSGVIPPTVTKPPYQSLNLLATVGAGPSSASLPITIGWQFTAGSAPICTAELQRSLKSGPWTNVPVGSPAATSTADQLTVSGGLYQYRVRLTGCDGGTTGWVTGPRFGYSLLQEANSQWSFSPASAWKPATCTACSLGYARYSISKNASATLKVPAAFNVGLVMETGPDRGSATVSVDGRSSTLSTFTKSPGFRLVVFKYGWPVAGAHTVVVTNLATPGHPRIDIDAAAVITGA